MGGAGVRVRIYCSSADRHGHQPLSTAIVHLLWKQRAAGVTVVNGTEGFGAGRVIHTARLVDLAAYLPVVIEWVDSREHFDSIWPRLEPLVREVMVTLESIEFLIAPHHHMRHLSSALTVADVMQQVSLTVAPTTPLAEVVSAMLERGVRCVSVVDGEARLLGVITSGDLVARGGLELPLAQQEGAGPPELPALAERTAADVMTTGVHTVTRDASIVAAAEQMLRTRVQRLPVVDRGRLVGLVSRTDILRTVADVLPHDVAMTAALGSRTVGDIALTDVPTVAADTPVADVVDAVVSTRLSRAVVVDDERHVLGIVTDAEVLRRVGEHEPSLVDRLMRRKPAAGPTLAHAKTAADLMLRPVSTVPRSLPIAEGIRVMMSQQHKLLVVVDEEQRLVGMVDRADALRAVVDGGGASAATHPPSSGS